MEGTACDGSATARRKGARAFSADTPAGKDIDCSPPTPIRLAVLSYEYERKTPPKARIHFHASGLPAPAKPDWFF